MSVTSKHNGKMELDDEEVTWAVDLESALLEDASVANIVNICRGKTIPDFLRAEVWQVCLGIQDKGDRLLHFNEIFDLPEQNVLRDDCQQFVAKLGNDDEDKVSVESDLESILTFYCKSENLQYKKGNGWIEILLPLLALKLHRADTYNLFEAIKKKYTPRCCTKSSATFHLFRLLVLYHDPELCSFLDTKQISPDLYALTWFQSLFAATCSLPVVLTIWDLYLQQADPFFAFFLALVMVVNAREMILGLKSECKQGIVDAITSMPGALEPDDVADFCSLARYYSIKTPASFRKDWGNVLCDCNAAKEEGMVSQLLCLPVLASELVDNASDLEQGNDPTERVRFFLVDCRPAEQYNAGHLPTAFHLDCNLMLQEPSAFSTAVQGLLSAQRQALAARAVAGGEHLCFLGSGRNEEDQYAHMVIASFLQKHTQYISMVTGGYQAVHEHFGQDVSFHLEDHNPQNCLVCSSDNELDDKSGSSTPNSASTDLLGKLGAVVRLKSAEVRGKLFEYIVNPSSSAQNTERHVSSSDKLGKRYRNMAPVFSIDDDHDGDSGHQGSLNNDESQEVVSTSAWLKKPETVQSFKCQEVTVNGYMYDSNLVVTDSHIFILRDIPGRRGYSHVVGRRSLAAIVKITSKKKHPELITFKYGMSEESGIVISDMDRFLIPKASEATKLVSEQILKQMKA